MTDTGGGSRRRVFFRCLQGTGALVLLSLPFRLDAVFGDLWFLIPIIVSCIGAAAQYYLLPNPRIGAGRRWLLYWTLPCLCAWLLFWRLHSLWILDSCELDGEAVYWREAVVVGEHWQPIAVDESSEVTDCGACFSERQRQLCQESESSVCRCIECMSFDPAAIEECWGKQRIARARTWLAVSYLSFAASLGGAIGLALLPLPPIRVFISYRRRDSAALVLGRMAQALRSDPDWQVFIDDKIKGGSRWRIDIRKNAETCDAFVIVIGPEWLEELKKRTAAGEKDWVRYEIETGIRRGVTLVPVVFGGAAMPSAADLGAGLDRLADIQAVDLNGAVTGEGGDTVVDEEAFEAAMEEVILAVRKARSAQLSQDWRGRGQDLTP